MVQMQLLSRSMHALLRSPTSMHRLASLSQPLLSSMASGTPHWWPSSSFARPAAHHVSRFPDGSRNMASSTGVKSQDLGKADTSQLNPSTSDSITPLGKGSAITQDMNKVEGTDNAAGGTAGIAGYELRSNDNDKQCRAAPVPHCSNDDDDDDDDDDVTAMYVFPYSSHRDGSIYKDMDNSHWKRDFAIANRNETPLSANAGKHHESPMLQIFSLRLAKIPVERGPVELYGYIAARDAMDSLLNYVVNVSRDVPIIVKQGSLINMSGPKRGIILIDATAIEYDMKIKTGKCESEDLQLIDGVSAVDFIDTWRGYVFTERIHGDCGAIDVTAACICRAVEATVEVSILQMQGSFKMRIRCITNAWK